MQELGPGPLFFVAGGVFFCFAEADVIAIVREMGRHFHGAEIVFDAFTPAGVAKANSMLARVGMEDAVMHWGLTDAKVMETWDAGIEVVEQFEYFRGLQLRGVPWLPRIMILANRLLKVMNIVHCRWR